MFSAAVLAYEINLTRLFSVTQFYHFAFMIVSIALLGFGASGTFLALFPGLAEQNLNSFLGWTSLAAGTSILLSYLVINRLPFDSFSLVVDRRQIWILVLHYLVLTMPFLFNGLAITGLLSAYPAAVGRTYAVNLTGSAAGCLLGLLLPSWLGGEGTVVFSSGLAALGAWVALSDSLRGVKTRFAPILIASFLLLFSLSDMGMRLMSGTGIPGLELHLSPYKALSYAQQYPDAQVVFQRWNSFSRVDVVRSQGIRSLPGLSYRYLAQLPAQDGLFIDGDELSPILHPEGELAFTGYLPAAIAYQLRPQAEVLVVEPLGGLDIVTARAMGAGQITVVEANPLVIEAVGQSYSGADLQVVNQNERSFLRRTEQEFDLIVFSLASTYHPVGSGAYSLSENYRYTVESFQEALVHLKPGGMLVITRWLQDPPSETLKIFGLSVTALEGIGGQPEDQMVTFRGYQTGTFLISKNPYTGDELETIRKFLAERSFDLTYAPDIQPAETNRYNILAEPVYSQEYRKLLESQPRSTYYAAYPSLVAPPTDDHPFFGHYFKWSQAPQVWAQLGHTWQPFGGAGYFVILVLLGMVILLAGALILLPVALKRKTFNGMRLAGPLTYFGTIGLAYLLVEIPLIQYFILFLGHPSYALAAVLFSLLVFSGLGSRFSDRFPIQWALVFLIVLILSYPHLLPGVFNLMLGLPLPPRLGVTLALLAPAGFLMGMPFPAAIRIFSTVTGRTEKTAWAWAVNGAVSVISSVVAALLALTFGFSWVLRLGAVCYLAALLTGAFTWHWGRSLSLHR
ncbi:MAG: hypothetical protein JXA13_15470 [Anaerolineales bacterium]|nr:hypothetical protein [Anaerolineales bacterium]